MDTLSAIKALEPKTLIFAARIQHHVVEKSNKSKKAFKDIDYDNIDFDFLLNKMKKELMELGEALRDNDVMRVLEKSGQLGFYNMNLFGNTVELNRQIRTGSNKGGKLE